MRRDTLAAFAEADAGRRARPRIYGLVVHEEVDWLVASGLRGRRSDRLAAEAVKIWADGGMSSRTAAIHGSYPVPPYGSGILFFSLDELTAMVRDFDAQRIPGLHPLAGRPGDRDRAGRLRHGAGRAPRATPGGTGSSTAGRCTRR